MCFGSSPPNIPTPPPPVRVDETSASGSLAERQRVMKRAGLRSTILGGSERSEQSSNTSQSKSLLGS